jgi:hypothetical protein
MYYISRGAFAILSKILPPVRESALVNPVKSKYRNKYESSSSLLFSSLLFSFVYPRPYARLKSSPDGPGWTPT